jgi:hypothetical protein
MGVGVGDGVGLGVGDGDGVGETVTAGVGDDGGEGDAPGPIRPQPASGSMHAAASQTNWNNFIFIRTVSLGFGLISGLRAAGIEYITFHRDVNGAAGRRYCVSL